MVTVTFTKDYSGRNKGEVWDKCPSILANRLVNKHKVAKYGVIKAKKDK